MIMAKGCLKIMLGRLGYRMAADEETGLAK